MTKKEKNKPENKPADKKEEKVISPAELINEQLIQKTKEASEFKDKYFRALAETENAKKRLMQEKKDLIAYSVSNIVEDMLGPIDSLENALGFTDNLSDELKNWAIGFKMILEQFKGALANHGVTSYDSVGKPFDPHYHEAIEMVETDKHQEGTVIEELMKGYRQDKRIIRVAKVKVAKKISDNKENKEENK
ncbi:MAG: Protein GrpE [Chlamydiia bacterium]|nr:Protein GrpE [Chlamydiia bacterium]MCH9618695.1 Protein GrpE [Chlamydiia bacterium]MCH9624402.1 Protein GrpE [Chlamydiia bacterium]